jgi:FolB domain-containing protein
MARTYIGFNDWEKEKKQDVAISVTLHADLGRACVSDEVSDTVDYKQIKREILENVEERGFQLIEKMAEDIALICLRHPQVMRVDVEVNKLSALRFAKSVSVEITREKRDGGE